MYSYHYIDLDMYTGKLPDEAWSLVRGLIEKSKPLPPHGVNSLAKQDYDKGLTRCLN